MHLQRAVYFMFGMCFGARLLAQSSVSINKLEIPDPMVLGTGSFRDAGYWRGEIVALHSDLGGILAWKPGAIGYTRVATPPDSFQGTHYASLLYANDDLTAVDLMRNRLFILSANGPDVPREIDIPNTASEVCALGERRYAFYIPKGGGEIEITDSSGSTVARIALAHRQLPGKTLRFFASAMRPKIACATAPATIVVFWEDSNLVMGFNTDGTRRWETVRPGFRPLVVRVSGLSYSRIRKRGGNDETVTITAFQGGTLLVQTVFDTHDISQGDTLLRYNTIKLDVKTGKVRHFGSGPKIVGSFSSMLIVEDTASAGGVRAVSVTEFQRGARQ